MIRILVAEDDPATRTLIREHLAQDPEMTVVAETPNGNEALSLVGQHRPDVVLMDISLEGLDGLTAAKRIRKEHPQTQVIILTNFAFQDFMDRMRESADTSGASALVLKPEMESRLRAVIRSVAQST